MAEEEDSYCRLCAEPTPKSQLIAPDEDVGVNSKIGTKMLWINIDVSTENILPNSICFSCFDQLERTWSFLHNVRTAQAKLYEIYMKKNESENSTNDIKIDVELAGKPVNEDWEDIVDLKHEVKPEMFNEELQIVTVDPNSLLDITVVKTEPETDDDDDFKPESDGINSSDSDLPLYQPVKKKNTKKRKKTRCCSDSSEKHKHGNENDPLTWADCKCVCANCDTECDNIMLLRIHAIQIHNRCCVVKCVDCSKICSNYKKFIGHMRTHKKKLRNCCEHCNKNFNSNSRLTGHCKLMHKDAIKMSCPSCGTMFESQEDLKDHRLKYSRSRKYRIKCETKDLKCDRCDKQFKSYGNLQTHKLVHTERKRNFSCHVCGKMFYTKGALGTHIFTHDDNKPFKCEFCPLTFKARGNLQSHRTLHSGIKPFICEQCGKSFRSKRHLKSHSIVHTDLMPYECHYCKKTFRFKTRLNLHLRQHTGVKPYKCNYCQREFTNGSNYKKHMKRRHNIDTSSRKKYLVVNSQNIDITKTKIEKEVDNKVLEVSRWPIETGYCHTEVSGSLPESDKK